MPGARPDPPGRLGAGGGRGNRTPRWPVTERPVATKGSRQLLTTLIAALNWSAIWKRVRTRHTAEMGSSHGGGGRGGGGGGVGVGWGWGGDGSGGRGEGGGAAVQERALPPPSMHTKKCMVNPQPTVSKRNGRADKAVG